MYRGWKVIICLVNVWCYSCLTWPCGEALLVGSYSLPSTRTCGQPLILLLRWSEWYVSVTVFWIIPCCSNTWPFVAHCCHMGTATKHPMPDRVKASFVIFDIWALWRSPLSVRVPRCQKLQMTYGLGYVHIDTSLECGFLFTASTSFTRTSKRSWSIVQGQLNACLPTISRKIESRKCFAKK